ncbi:hypothetical protein NliqN6_4800 [Naganishia liquefaciens]|uniref:Uncharacterized protein n=1 Tax=Naganishia liquefaciens TaxID=104408 RepID=A0A8H3TX15_9TREE|nr:hypothetical protein NliqN6_4800 [Naganishia liquefaciens]
MLASSHPGPSPLAISHQPRNEQSPDLEAKMSSTLLRIFVTLHDDGCPSFEVAAPSGVLHYLFPPLTTPGSDACPFVIQHIPTSKDELVADLSQVLNTRQLKPNEDHFRILPSAALLRERLAQQTPLYPPPAAHPTHLRVSRDRAPIDRDPELVSLAGYRTIWVHPSDISSYLVAMGFRYIGSHVESCGPRSPGDIWDIHTFVGGEKLNKLLYSVPSLSTSLSTQSCDENIATPRAGPRVTFREEDLIKM